MNIKKHKKEIREYKSIKSKIASNIGAIILEEMPKHDPRVHFFDFKKSLLKNKITITIYCERPGLLIGKSGSTVDKLTSRISDQIKKDVSINFYEFEPIIYPIYDIVQ